MRQPCLYLRGWGLVYSLWSCLGRQRRSVGFLQTYTLVHQVQSESLPSGQLWSMTRQIRLPEGVNYSLGLEVEGQRQAKKVALVEWEPKFAVALGKQSVTLMSRWVWLKQDIFQGTREKWHSWIGRVYWFSLGHPRVRWGTWISWDRE